MTRCVIIILITYFGFPSVYAQDSVYSFSDSVTYEENLDQQLFRKLNGHRTSFLDIVVPLSEKHVTIPSLVVPTALFVSSKLNDNYYDENSSALLAVSNGMNLVFTFGMKQIIKRKRPPESLDNIYFDKNFIEYTDRYSFPSGHASTTFNTAALLTLRYPDNPILISGFYLRAVAISFGRIYMGNHYPLDVLTGAVIGTGAAFLTNSIRKELINIKASVLNEEDRKELGSDRVNQYVALGSMIAMDLINYFIFGLDSKITKNMRVDLGSTGSSNTLNFTYHF
jgi:hypothetical protein